MIAASRREALLFGASAAALASAPGPSWAAEPRIDRIVRRTLAAFDVPGVGVAMNTLSPLADFSYDFHDLHVERVK